MRALEHNFFRRTDHSSCTINWSSADGTEATAAVPNFDPYDDDCFLTGRDDQKIDYTRSRSQLIDSGYYYNPTWSSPDAGQHVLTVDSHFSSNAGDVPQSPIDVLSWWSDSP